MTKGIIDKVFANILDRPKLKDADREQLEQLKQELKAEIEKAFNKWIEWEGLNENADLLDVEYEIIGEKFTTKRC